MRKPPDVTPSYIVIGTSAGGTQALAQIFKDLPADLPAAELAVLHVPRAYEKSRLPERLMSVGHLPVKVADVGERIMQGVAYIARPDRHLIVEGDHFGEGADLPEHRSRPAIDLLFRQRRRRIRAEGDRRDPDRNVAGRYGRTSRGVGRGRHHHRPGAARAERGDMPRSAMKPTTVDYCVDLEEIGPLLDLLVRRSAFVKRGALETGLAQSVRSMRQRLRLLARLLGQSAGNRRIRKFLIGEVALLESEIRRLRRILRPRRERVVCGAARKHVAGR